ncbi:Transcription factor SOX-6 [Marasmius tenuissimus]|uniref:Transcription factor SOX-6 n=1 Tax=Marasmius tenuissimus TaxID=585030 RepID=A0ABR2ZMJ0_9AGAR
MACRPKPILRTRTRKPNTPHVRRPLNAFMVYRSEKSKTLREENLASGGFTKHQTTFSGEISAMWHALDPVEKKKYENKARELDIAHKRANPGYRYQPGLKKGKGKKGVRRGEDSSIPSSSMSDASTPPISPSPSPSPPPMMFAPAPSVVPPMNISSSDWRYYQPEMAVAGSRRESSWSSQPPTPSSEDVGLALPNPVQFEFCSENPIFQVPTPVEETEPVPVVVTPQIPPEIVALNPGLEWLNYLDRELWTDDQVALAEEARQEFHFHSLGFGQGMDF